MEFHVLHGGGHKEGYQWLSFSLGLLLLVKSFGRHATSNYSVCLAFGETKSRKHGCGSSAAALAPNLFQRADSPLFFFLVVKSAEIG